MESVTEQPTSSDKNKERILSHLASASGLGHLELVETLTIIQQVRLLEAMTNYEALNEYRIENESGQTILKAVEGNSSLWMRQCCGQHRGFTIHVIDSYSEEIVCASRDFKLCVGCCWCADKGCGYEIKIESPAGHVIGSVRQHTSVCAPYYKVYDESDQHILTIRGPECVYQDCCFSSDVILQVMKLDGTSVGTIFKRWNGCSEELLYRNRFGVTFLKDLDVKAKAILLCTVFLFDFMYFEYKT